MILYVLWFGHIHKQEEESKIFVLFLYRVKYISGSISDRYLILKIATNQGAHSYSISNKNVMKMTDFLLANHNYMYIDAYMNRSPTLLFESFESR